MEQIQLRLGFIQGFYSSEVWFHHICFVFVHMDDWTRGNLSLQLGRKRCRIREPSSWRKKTCFVLLKLCFWLQRLWGERVISNSQLSFLSDALLLLLWSHIAGSGCVCVRPESSTVAAAVASPKWEGNTERGEAQRHWSPGCRPCHDASHQWKVLLLPYLVNIKEINWHYIKLSISFLHNKRV